MRFESPHGTFTGPSTVPLDYYLRVPRRHLLLIAIVLAVSVAPVLAYVLTRSPAYVATAKILVQRAAPVSTTPTEADMATESQLAESAPVAESVLQTLDMSTSTEVLLRNLSVEQIGTSAFLAINYTASDPRTAIVVSNAFARSYIAFRNLNTNLPGTAELIEPASSPPTAELAPVVRDAALSLAAGLVLALLLAFLVERLQDRARSDDEITSVIGAPVLVTVPIQSRRRGQRMGNLQVTVPYGFLSAYVQQAPAAGTSPVVLVSSPDGGNDKSIVTANIALTLSRGGLRVIAISLDSNVPQLHTVFGVSDEHGLTDLFFRDRPHLGEAIDEAVRSSPDPNLRVLTRGDHGDPPIDRRRWSEILEHLRSRSDLVLVDGPPVLTAPATSVLAAFADVTLLVIGEGRGEKRAVLSRAAAAVRSAGGGTLGVIRIKRPRHLFTRSHGRRDSFA